MKRALLLFFYSLGIVAALAGGVTNPGSGSGSVTGAATGTANTFTALQSFGAGLTLTAPSAANNYILFAPAGGTTQQLFRFKTNDVAAGSDFGVGAVQAAHAGNAGTWPSEPRQDNIYYWGYNYGLSGAKLNSAEHQFGEHIESYYKTNSGIVQLEQYYSYTSPDNSVNYRPFGITINLTDNTAELGLRGERIILGDKGGANDWFTLTSTATAGLLTLTGASKIEYTGSATDFITKNGSPVLGLSGTTGRLFAGYSSVDLFSTTGAQGGVMTMHFGSTDANRGSLRWNGSRWEFQSINAATGNGDFLPFDRTTDMLVYQRLSSSLTNTAGDVVQLGTVTPYNNRTILTTVDILMNGGGGASQRYVIPRVYDDGGGTTWYEVQPIVSSTTEGIALDCRPAANGVFTIRLRRKTAGSGTAAFSALVGLESINTESFVVSVASSSGGTVGGFWKPSVTAPIALGSQTVGTSQVTIAHGLGYAPGIVNVTMTSAGNVYLSAASDATNIYLTADASSRTCLVSVK